MVLQSTRTQKVELNVLRYNVDGVFHTTVIIRWYVPHYEKHYDRTIKDHCTVLMKYVVRYHFCGIYSTFSLVLLYVCLVPSGSSAVTLGLIDRSATTAHDSIRKLCFICVFFPASTLFHFKAMRCIFRSLDHLLSTRSRPWPFMTEVNTR